MAWPCGERRKRRFGRRDKVMERGKLTLETNRISGLIRIDAAGAADV